MPARNHSQWLAKPALEEGEWIDSRVYSDQQIFNDEMENIFKKVWVPVCHESELPEPYNFRTTSIAGEPIISNFCHLYHIDDPAVYLVEEGYVRHSDIVITLDSQYRVLLSPEEQRRIMVHKGWKIIIDDLHWRV